MSRKKLREGEQKLGVRFRYHKERKHGATRDEYWFIRHTVDGKQIQEGLGYSSEKMTETKAISIGQELKDNKRQNKRNAGKRIARLPESFREMQDLVREEKREEAAALQADKDANIPFEDFFKTFIEDRETEGRPKDEITKSLSRYDKWVHPIIGHIPPRKIKILNLKGIVRKMERAKKPAAPSTIIKVIGMIGHVYNHHIVHHDYPGSNPVVRKAILPPKVKKHDNKRERFLTPVEVKELLEALPEQVSQMAKISLLCGFRAGEIFKLKWADIVFSTGRIYIRDTKSGKSRTIVMGHDVCTMLDPMQGKKNELIFPAPNGKAYTEIPKSFKKTVDDIGLNDGITDRRQRVVFHTMRHTCASWLVDGGVDLYTVKEVLGHSSITVTERYVHGGAKVAVAAAVLDGIMSKARNQQGVKSANE